MPQYDSVAVIKLEKNDNDVINYTSQSAYNQFAVFSEVYYARGWKAFVDKKEMPIVKTNYALRGLALAPGKHDIEFRFEPQGYVKGRKITMIANIVLLALLVFTLFIGWRKRKTGSV
jgi:uncharacterized membrane protein YfhO